MCDVLWLVASLINVVVLLACLQCYVMLTMMSGYGALLVFSCFFVFQFFASDDRIKAVRRMIMAATTEQRKAALNLLLPYQRSDFEGIFRAMDGIFQNALESQYIGLLKL